METITVGVFESMPHAESAISELREKGVHDTDISYVYSTPEGVKTEKMEGEHPVRDDAAKGAGAGAIVGAIAGLAVANGILPGLGTLFVAGPLATALGFAGAVATTAAGAITGAAAGGLVGALVGLGVSRDDAEIYEERVRRGGILVTASSPNAAIVRETFEKHGAEEIREYVKGK